MKLNVLERVLLGNALSGQEGNFVTLKLIRNAREEMSFNDEENRKLHFANSNGKLVWDPEMAMEIGEVEIPLSDTVKDLIKKILLDMNDKAKLTEHHFSLYEKFVVSN